MPDDINRFYSIHNHFNVLKNKNFLLVIVNTILFQKGNIMNLKCYAFNWIFFVVIALVVITSGCSPPGNEGSGLQLGVDIPASEPVVKLAAVMENPSEFNGKNIVMHGFVSGQCASLCEFFFKDGVHTATIYPQGFKFPKLEHNKSVTLYAQITSGEQVVFSALGLKM